MGLGNHIIVSMVMTWLISTTLVDADVTVETDIGTIVGKLENVYFNGTEFAIKEFLVYAKAPVEELRFEKPERKQPFTTPFIAQTPPPFCQQNPAYLDFFGISISPELQSEDCLRLNIFMPQRRQRRRDKESSACLDPRRFLRS